MSSSVRPIRRLLACLALAAALGSCNDGASLTFVSLATPTGLQVMPVSMRAVRIEWDDIGGTEVQTYRIERRANLQGAFATLTSVNRGAGRIIHLDTEVEPETFYGYRVVAVDGLGNESEPSVIEGGKTPSLPGIRVQTLSLVPAEISDPDGYLVVVEGPTEDRFPIGVNNVVKLSPLPVGTYTVRLEGVSAACRARPGESLERSVGVTDQGTATITEVRFAITCRDATKGEITAGVDVVGDQVPVSAQFTIDVSGIASDATLPESERVYSRTLSFGSGGGETLLENLRPGEYVLTIGPVPLECLRQGSETQRLQVLALSSLEADFEVRCGSAAPNEAPVAQPNGPYTAAVGEPIAFNSAGSADSDGTIVSYNWQFGDGTTASGASPTKSYTTGGSYVVTLSVTDDRGASGTATTTATIGNQPPVARANGPYTGVAGTPIAFSAAGSTDPDGTIAAYEWDFGDGATGINQSVTHTYAAEGTYQVELTVRDNNGASDTDQATVTVGPATGGGGPFTWANSFGTLDQASQLVPLTLTLDLTGDSPSTPGAEALDRWVVDLLEWDPAVLRFFAFTPGPGVTASADLNEAQSGRLKLFGTQSAASSTGLLTLGTIRFRVVGANGTRTTTETKLGLLLGTAATGGHNYLSETAITEGSYSVGGGPTPTGTVRGVVTSSQGGGIQGATVTVTPGGTATTNASGQYSVSGVPVGSGTASVSNLPAGCTAPPAKSYAISSSGQVAVVDFTATCAGSSSVGTVAGTVTRSGGGGALAGVTVTATPGGAATTNASGQFTIGQVPVGSGTVAVSNLPSGCQVPASKPYSIVSAGQTATVDFTVTCTSSTPTGTVTGTVKDNAGAAIANATVTVAPGGVTATDAAGQYTVGNVALGSGTVSIGSLPAGCAVPSAKPYTVGSAGEVVMVDFTVNCSTPPPSGTVAGTVTRSTGGGLAGATVTVTPGGTATTNASGQYSVSNVAVGNGTVTVSNLPAGCTAPAAKSYSIASAGQTATVDFTVTCQAATPNSIRGSWTVSGTTATLEIRATITQGALGSLQGNLRVNSSRLRYTGSAAPTAPALGNPTAANPPQTVINFGGFNTSPAGSTGDVGIIKLIFDILPGVPQTVNSTITEFGALNPSFVNITPSFQKEPITVDPLTLP